MNSLKYFFENGLLKNELIAMARTRYHRRELSSFSAAFSPVLGIETSCDDTAVCILGEDRRVLCSRRYSDRSVQLRLGGTCPSVVAHQHRALLRNFVDECLEESKFRLSDLGGITVTTRPGLVVALKAGIGHALGLARKGRLPLACVHHMQAHATAASLCDSSVIFPFLTLLISGGHSIIAIAHGPDRFEILAESVSGSCGECLDKVLRALPGGEDTIESGHPGAILERLASRCGKDGLLRYSIQMPASSGADFDFSHIKAAYLTLLEKERLKDDFDRCDFCASVQHCVAGYLAGKLHHCLEYLLRAKTLDPDISKIVVSGGVASNMYILKILRLLAAFHGFDVVTPPPQLCSDNAEMIAWNGLMLFNSRFKSASVFWPDELPVSVYAEARCPIGVDNRSSLPERPLRRLSLKHLAAGSVVVRSRSVGPSST